MQAEADKVVGGRNENQKIDKDIRDGDVVCTELRGKIQALKSEIELVKRETNIIEGKCHYFRKELEVFQK